MTHDELLERVNEYISSECDCESCQFINAPYKALRAVVELHKVLLVKDYENDTDWYECQECTRGISPSVSYPCPTIQAIEKELQ